MPKNGANISLTSYDDIFSTEESRQTEQIQQIPIADLHPFKTTPSRCWMMRPCSGRWRA